MPASVTTVAASNITATGGRMNGSMTAPEVCCICPTCTFTERFTWGYNGVLSTQVVADSVESCCDDGDCGPCTGDTFNYTLGGLDPDRTISFRANVIITGCGGGTCSSTGSGSTLTFKTCANAMTLGTPANQPPTDDSVEVSVAFNPNVDESSASLRVQYKLDTEPTVWTDGDIQTGITANGTRTFTISGLLSSTAYDFRFVATRNAASCSDNSVTSSEGSFTTASSAITDTLSDTVTETDSVAGVITGEAALGEESLEVSEDAEILLLSGEDTVLSGVWFYHFPTQSYWFWDFDGLSCGTAIVNGDNQGQTIVALGADVYVADDETYPWDDRDQLKPISDNTESEIRLSLVPRTIDGGGGYFAARTVDVKWGASPETVDPLGKVDIDLVTDVYPQRPVPPDARLVLATRRADIAPESGGLDEWRPYSLGRVPGSNVLGIRFSFPTGLTPKRRNPIRIDRVRITAVKTPMRRKRN